MKDGVTFKELFDELRRLEDCVTYYENKVLRLQIAIDEHARLVLESVPKEPSEEDGLEYDGRQSRISDELLDETIKACNGDYEMVSKRLKYGITMVYRRRPKPRNGAAILTE